MSAATKVSEATEAGVSLFAAKTWQDDGFVLLKNYYRGATQDALRSYVEELQAWPETAGKWMKYFERDAQANRLLCRVENFLPYHPALAALLKGQGMLSLVSDLMQEPALLFKEKINYKLPGGNGFTAHQDAPAFVHFGQKYHITLMISVDATTVENGCLEIVRKRHAQEMLPQATDGSLDPAFAQTLAWEPITTEPGDVLLFDSYIPHRSGKNRTDKPRRAYYITYNRASEGDFRDQYYADKRDNFPPEIERVPGRDYSKGAGIYNVGNPITK